MRLKTRKVDDLVGLIYPIPTRFVNRLFEDRNIFVKYVVGRPANIKKGLRFLVYASQGIGAVVGEAQIDKVEYMPMENALQEYGNRIFLDKDELQEYASQGYSAQKPNRQAKDLLLLHLGNFLKYSTPIKLNFPITMVGHYLTNYAYTSITKNKTTQ